jgi:hypothetical protein
MLLYRVLQRWSVLVVVLSTVLSTPLAVAATFEIALRDSRTTDAIRDGVVRAKRIDGQSAAIEVASKIPSAGTIALPAGLWELTLDAPGIWAAPKFARDAERIVFDAYPTGTITGEVRIDGVKVTALSDANVRFTTSAGAAEKHRIEGVTACSASGGTLQCSVPAGTHDLRIATRGHSAHYAWATAIRAGVSSDLGVIRLQRGASLTGVVELHPEVAVPLREVRVVLTPFDTGSEERRTAGPIRQGFFQMTGLAPGDYVLTSVAAEYRSDSRRVRIIDGMAADLKEPLVLSPLRRVEVAIEPPLDPDGKPWRVGVGWRRGAAGNPLAHIDPVSESSADETGHFVQKVVQDGAYVIDIMRSGTVWTSVEINVDRDVVRVPVIVKSRVARGRITRGGRPLSARLRFGGEFGASQQLIVSDEDGLFRGVLPTEEEEWEILVESDAPLVRRKFKSIRGVRGASGELEFRIDVPATRRAGRVIREDGAPAQSALIHLQSLGEIPVTQAFDAGEDGVFELSGLDVGRYRVRAEERGRESEIVDIEITEADPTPVLLVVRERRRVIGRVVAGSRPITGAEVRGTPRGVPVMSDSSTRTSGSGEFSLRLPANVQVFDLLINADGFPVTMRRMTVSPEPVVIDVAVPFGSLAVEAPEKVIVHLRHRGAEVGHILMPFSAERHADKDGPFDRLTFTKLEVGEYAVCIAQRCVSAYVTPFESASVSLRGR